MFGQTAQVRTPRWKKCGEGQNSISHLSLNILSYFESCQVEISQQ
jgi:hypothetical protein